MVTAKTGMIDIKKIGFLNLPQVNQRFGILKPTLKRPTQQKMTQHYIDLTIVDCTERRQLQNTDCTENGLPDNVDSPKFHKTSIEQKTHTLNTPFARLRSKVIWAIPFLWCHCPFNDTAHTDMPWLLLYHSLLAYTSLYNSSRSWQYTKCLLCSQDVVDFLVVFDIRPQKKVKDRREG